MGILKEFDFIQGGYVVSGANFTGIDFVIAEIFVSYCAVFKPNQAIAGNRFGVEFHLHLGIQRNYLQGGNEISTKSFSASL